MYINGKYEYKEKSAYEFLLIKVMVAFAFLYVALNILKGDMYAFVYWGTVFICNLMIAHLWLRFLHAEDVLSYGLNEY